ncbi:12809_t:CDS:2, partial [Ambispora gerdemannii]
MTNNAQEQINLITNKSKIRYLDISNRDLTGNVDLKEFTGLISLNSYNNKFESLDFLNSLPNKEQLKKLNFFGNQIKEIDLAHLFSTFPKLEYLNCENNPLSAKNLDNLSSEHQGNNNQQQNAQYLQTLIQQGSSPVKDNKQNGNNNPLLVGGLVIFGITTLAIDYLLGKKSK